MCQKDGSAHYNNIKKFSFSELAFLYSQQRTQTNIFRIQARFLSQTVMCFCYILTHYIVV